MKKQFQNILTFVVIFLIVNLIVNFFFNPNQNNQAPTTVTLVPAHTDFELGSNVTAELKNDTKNIITLKSTCPNEPLAVWEQQNGQWIQKHKQAQIACDAFPDIVLKPGDKHSISFANWNHAIFSEVGQYKLQATVLIDDSTNPGSDSQQTQITTQTQQIAATAKPTTQQIAGTTGIGIKNLKTQVIESAEFQIKPQGWMGWLWMILFYQPFYNGLIFFINIIPGKGLGLGIILLTLLIKTILLIPNQKALESQRKMQDIQPKLNKIKEKYKDNQEMVGKETLAIMQESKVNPLGSCLPMLVQFPILIALYQVVQSGLNPDNSYLLYSGLQGFNFSSINPVMFGILDLTKVNPFILPLFVGALQFLQMKLAFVRNKKKAEANPDAKPAKSEMDTANNMMLYVMPVMIAVLTASVPAGVGIYWCTSTVYGIAQQLVVNKNAEKDNVKVRVIS